jgi:uncharacterized membrane protein YagU involved in acid resistance
MQGQGRSSWRAVVGGGLIAGVLDITYACAFWAVRSAMRPQRILQSVAAGLLGQAAFTGGAVTAALGLAAHLAIAITIAAVYYIAARAWSSLWRHPWFYGALYGLCVYVVMNYVVVPLSAAASRSMAPTDWVWVLPTIVVHAVFIGIPCALAVRVAMRRAS